MATHWRNPRYSPNAPYLRSEFVWPPRPKGELAETFDFSMKMHETSVRLGHMLAAGSFKADAVQSAVGLLAWPDISGDECGPITEGLADSDASWSQYQWGQARERAGHRGQELELAPVLERPQGRRLRRRRQCCCRPGRGRSVLPSRRARALQCLPRGHVHMHMRLCWVRLSNVPLRPAVSPDRRRTGDFDVLVIKSPPSPGGCDLGFKSLGPGFETQNNKYGHLYR